MSGTTIPNAERRKRGQFQVTVRLYQSELQTLDSLRNSDDDTRPNVFRRLLQKATRRRKGKGT